MEKVVQELNDTNKYKMILFGGYKKEAVVLDTLENKYGNVFNAAGKFPFSDELSLMSNLELMVAMDSGNAHLAAMYGVPTLTLWGVTHPFAGFYPFGQPDGNAILADRNRYPLIPTSIYGNKFPTGYDNVMATIEPKQVVEKIVEILNVS
jgi:ADP-heptose:LPS heptosyltransferase